MSIATSFVRWLRSHKKTSIAGIVALVAIVWIVIDRSAGTTDGTTYVLATATRGSVIASVSGTGQVLASNQVDLKSKVSGAITALRAVVGTQVSEGSFIASIDPGSAAYDLDTAKLSYEQALADSTENRGTAAGDVDKAYLDARATLASAATNLADVLSGIDDLLSGYIGSETQHGMSVSLKAYADRTTESYYGAKKILDASVKSFSTVSVTTSKSTLRSIVSSFASTSVAVAQAAKYAQDEVVYLRNREDKDNTAADAAYASVTALVSKANGTADDIVSIGDSIDTAEKNLADVTGGSGALDLRSQEQSLAAKQLAYDDHFVRAPFTGVIAVVPVHAGDEVSSGATIATLITKEKIATISLNEIDAAKVAGGQKATLTFDAIPDLAISGKVLELDLVGTVSQGVVNYTVTIGFDSDDDRVLSGMSVTANIITDVRTDVITVAPGAIKTQGGVSYVQVPDDITAATATATASSSGVTLTAVPRMVPVTLGLAGDDAVEIISGLNEGAAYVARTITSTTSSSTSGSTPSLFGGGGGTFRAGTGGIGR